MNVKNILVLLEERFNFPEYDTESAITDEERKFASTLEDIIKDAINEDLYIDSFQTLVYEDESSDPEPVPIVDECDSDFEEVIIDGKKAKKSIDFDYKVKVVQFWRSGIKKLVKFETVKHRYRKVKDIRQLYRWEEQIRDGGSRNEKLLKISAYVLEKFKNAADNLVPIHDLDLKRWAVKARDEYNLSSHLFTASSFWIQDFKVKHRIVSRKINKFVTQKQITNKEELKRQSREFVNMVKSDMLLVGEDAVFNSDQSGFNLEMHSGRTLAYKGTSKVEVLAQSLHSLTHSYTIQPIISASGILLSPLLIVLQEKDGKFGPTVEENLYIADNIVSFPSSSGKLTSNIAVKWFRDVFLPNTGEKSVLCLDSWTGQTEKHFESIDKGDKSVKIRTIPAGTTGWTQPLDVYTFRSWKNFIKHFSDIVILYDYDINLHLRNNILKLQSLTHNQFSSPRFVNLFKYAWYKSGYVNEKPPHFENPVEYCFRNCDSICDSCENVSVIRCAWCKESKCIHHFFDPQSSGRPHYCTNFQA